MKIEMNMCKCTINEMRFQELTEEGSTGNVFISSGGFICNSLIEDDETVIVLADLAPITNTIWNVIDMGNNMVMIKDVSTNLYWTTKRGALVVSLEHLRNENGVFQLFRKTDFVTNMIPLFYLDSMQNLFVGYSRVNPVEGDILILTELNASRGVFREIPAE